MAWMAQSEFMLPHLTCWEAQIFRNVMAEWAKCSMNQDDFEILAILVRAVEIANGSSTRIG
jgi:hypothetical protein